MNQSQPEMKHSRIAQAIAADPWLITYEGLQQIIAIAEGYGDIEALETRLGQRLDDTDTVTMRGDTAVVPVIGPIFKRANLFTRISGATSTDMLARDITAALDNPAVRSIVLNIDSPGGQAGGISELADLIYEGRAAKPITAYVGDLGASAGYWLASAADSIVVNDAGILGSIGVVLVADIRKDSGRVEIVSSGAPNKRPDLNTVEGRSSVQALADRLEQVFIERVARNRGVTVETVRADFGQGGLLVGADAVDAGMADSIGNFEGVITGLTGGRNVSTPNQAGIPVITADRIKADHPDVFNALITEARGGIKEETERHIAEAVIEARTEGAKAERERIQGVYEQGAQLPGHEALIAAMLFDGKTTGPEAAVAILAAEKKARGDTLDRIKSESPKPVAPSADDKPGLDANTPVEDRAKSEWQADAALRFEFSNNFDSFLAWKKADEAGRVKILKRAS